MATTTRRRLRGFRGEASLGHISAVEPFEPFRAGAQPERPRVSVVIPTYNRRATLQRLLAALRHSHEPAGGMEIIVVDDGSVDGTAELTAAAGATHIWQRNAGTAAARDRGWRAARGDNVVFFDDDVIPAPDVIKLLDAALEHADGVGAHFVPMRHDSVISHYTHADGLIDHRVYEGDVHWLITGAAAFRRSALERVGGFDLGFVAAGEDVDLSIRMLSAGCTLTVERRAVVQHDHRERFRQLLETCYRYGTFSRQLAGRHSLYRGERLALALRRLNPVQLWRAYTGFRTEASRRRSLAFLALHQLVVVPYGLGLLRGRFESKPLAPPSWRRAPATLPASDSVVLIGQRATYRPEPAVRQLEPSVEVEASAV